MIPPSPKNFPAPGRQPERRSDLEDSPILRMVAWGAVPLSILASLVIFLQGHNLPGGGFIGGLLAAVAGAVYLLAFGTQRARRFAWWKISIAGLLIALLTGTVSLLAGHAFMDHTIWEFSAPLLGSVHWPTATFFDLGVYLVVFGTLMTIFVELALEEGS